MWARNMKTQSHRAVMLATTVGWAGLWQGMVRKEWHCAAHAHMETTCHLCRMMRCLYGCIHPKDRKHHPVWCKKMPCYPPRLKGPAPAAPVCAGLPGPSTSQHLSPSVQHSPLPAQLRAAWPMQHAAVLAALLSQAPCTGLTAAARLQRRRLQSSSC